MAEDNKQIDIESVQVSDHESRLPLASEESAHASVEAETVAVTIAELHEAIAKAREQTGQVEQAWRTTTETAANVADHSAQIKSLVNAATASAEAAKSAATDAAAALAATQSANSQQIESARLSGEAAGQTKASAEVVTAAAQQASEIIGRVQAIRDEAVALQSTIAERNSFIQRGLEHVAEVRRKLEEQLEGARQSAGKAEQHNNATKMTSENASALLTAVQAVRERAQIDTEAVTAVLRTVEAHSVTTKRLAQQAETIEAKTAAYHSELESIREGSVAQKKLIDDLLSGATDASLGGAYRKRSETFKAPEKNWQTVFILSIIGLLAVAGVQTYMMGGINEIPEWQQLARMLLFKMPFLVPLVWLAIHSARQAALAKRMEEEYGFKATTSMSFEGYRRQMKDVGQGLDPNSPLAQLCNDALRTIAAHPGRMYDKHRMDPTPGTAAAEVLKPVVETAGKVLTAKQPD